MGESSNTNADGFENMSEIHCGCISFSVGIGSNEDFGWFFSLETLEEFSDSEMFWTDTFKGRDTAV
jgi:hypothetical protein